MNEQNKPTETVRRLPEWLKRPLPSGSKCDHVLNTLKKLKLETVCGSAACPNRGECFSAGTATFMIMGAVCTRNCRFCAVHHGQVEPLVPDEPDRVAQGVAQLKLKHVVITSVTRDDLPDGGAAHFAAVINAIHTRCPNVTVEVLTPDFQGDYSCLDTVCAAQPEVFNHNVETSRRLTPMIRSGADFERSLSVLAYVASKPNGPTVKSGMMLGLGENHEEIMETLSALRQAGVQMLTIGQYLRPTKDNHEVIKYYPPEEFDAIAEKAKALGFAHVAAGPFVRSSYHAELSLKQRKD